MAKQTVNIGSTANDGTGDQLRTAFDKLNQNNDEIYGDNFVTEDMLNDDIVGADELKVTGNGAAGQILTSDGDGTFSWSTGVTGDITGVEAGDGLTGGGTGGDVTLNVGAGTGITVAADTVSLASTVQDEITLNTAKTGITPTQASDITTNNSKVSDQTVVLTEGANVTITGTYPNFTIASDDVVGAVTSVNGDDGVVVLDSSDITENTNLYYTEARVSANTDVAANTAKTGITAAQAADIVTNNAKNTDQTVTLTEGANVTITGTYPDFTIASDDVVGAVNSVNGDTGVVVLGTDDVDEGSSNLYYTEARVAANSAVALNTAKTGITTQQASDITANNAKNTDQTVTLTNAGNITIGGTYPDFTIASADVVGAVTSVNGAVGVVVLDTADVAEDTNLYYTEARVAANSAVTLNTAKTGITTQQASDITDNNAKVSNVTTDLSITGTTDARTIVSSDGTDAIIPVATTSVSGLMSTAIFDEHVINNAKVSGTATNLGKTVSGTGFSITSSDGTDVDLSLADTDNWGLMSDEMFDAQVLNNAKLTNATHTGEVTGSGALTITDGAVVADRLATDAVTTVKILDANVTTDKIADVNVTTAKLANGAVSHDKLEDRYTEAVSVTTLTGAYSLDWSTGAIFVMSGSLTGNIEFDFTNFKVGQTIDIYNLTGAHTVTFDSDAATSETFNKCGGVDYAGASTNLIQVQCVDDSATAVFNYAVSAYVSDTTPS